MEATIGGTRRHITDVARGQLAAGVEVHLAVGAERQPDFRADLARLREEGAGVLELPMSRAISPRQDWAHAHALARHLREVRPDVVHTHSSKGGALGRWASIRSGIGKRVHTPHTFAFLFAALFSPIKRRTYRAIEGYLGRRTDRVIAVSAEEADTIRASGVCPPDRVRVVHNGIDLAAYQGVSAVDRAALGVPANVPLASVVGLMYEAKGQDVALEVLTHPECAELHLLLAGEGERRADYESLARTLGVADRAHFLGWRDDVPALVAACDFLLLPSRWEGLPTIVLEAFALGRPVVATRVDGTGGVVVEDQTGYTASVGDARDLAAACGRLLARSTAGRAALGASGREIVGQRFTVDAMVRGLIDVYEEVL